MKNSVSEKSRPTQSSVKIKQNEQKLDFMKNKTSNHFQKKMKNYFHKSLSYFIF